MASSDDRIKFRGFAPEEKKASIYSSFDVLLFPSLYEGFCSEIFEAQALGIPVVLYKKSKIPKETRKYCFEAEDEAHMAQIMDDLMKNGYSESRRKSAAEYARSFTWEKCARETLKAYREILKR
jgi:alpha-1,3-rhamnosyl/mannosyltransferase